VEIVLAHTNTDFDSLASQLAVTKLHPGTRMVPGYPLAANIRAFLALYRDSLPIVDLQYIDFEKVKHLYIVDCQHVNRLDEVGRKLITEHKCTYTVFDHHALDPAGLGTTGRDDSIIMPMGACTTIIVDKLRRNNVPLTRIEATLLLLGIYEDTGCLTYSGTTETDALSVAYLLGHSADLNQVNNFMNPKMDHEQTELFQSLLSDSRTVTVSGARIVIAGAECMKYIEGLATLTRRLMEVVSADAAVSVVFMRDRTYIVGRSDHRLINVRALAQAFNGDGHFGAASAVTKSGTVAENLQRVEALLREHARPETTARDLMVAPVPTIKSDVSMDEAWRIMLRYGQNGLVVVDDNEITGIVSRRDVDKSMHHKLGHAPVRGFMSRPVVTINEDTPVSEIQHCMAKQDIGRLPVLDEDGVLRGIVTRNELLKQLYGKEVSGDLSADMASVASAEKRLHFEDQLQSLGKPTQWLFAEIGRTAARLGMVAYAVGGCVRDLILGRSNFDLDFVVEGSAIRLAEALESAYPGRFEVLAKHERFHTATIAFIADKRHEVDISTARVEYYEFPAALPTVEASRLEQDLYRRDFTINALAVCVNPDEYGDVVDFFDGIGDIQHKLIRILHQFSFIEDPTRIVRAARFAARLGFSLEQGTRLQAERAITMGVFDDLGGFRLKEELKLILESEKRLDALDMLNDLGGGLRYLAADLVYDRRVRRLLRIAERLLSRNQVEDSWIVFLALLMADLTREQVEAVMERLYLANQEREWIRAGLQLPKQLERTDHEEPLSRSEIYQLLHGHSDPSLAISACLAPPLSHVRRRIKLYLDELRNVRVEISGNDLLQLGFPRGPKIKEALQKVHEAKLDGRLQTAQQELDYVRSAFPDLCLQR
jgi:tRNA nucleotidyltransferase (CCA-adding enzyme)